MDSLNTFEQIQYEARPIVYAVLATYSFFNKQNSPILLFSGILFTVACLYVLNARYNYRGRYNIR